MVIGCSTNEQFPELVSEKIPEEQFTINNSFYMAEPKQLDSISDVISDDLPGNLIRMKELYERKAEDFDLEKMELLWNDVNNMSGSFTVEGIKNWISGTGFLLEITGREMYAAALEKIQYAPNYIQNQTETDDLKLLLEPYIFTRNNDFFHINLFTNVSFEFEHSLFGHVKITQETRFPESGIINLKINTEKKRYMEIFFRIPEWAEGATVTMQNVKYIAPPGNYCQIAKSWSDGDLLEVYLPLENLPNYMKNQ